MLRQALELCPDELWDGGSYEVPFWQVAYHTLYFTDLYLQPNLEAFTPWELHRDEYHDLPWPPGSGTQPARPYSKDELLDYWRKCDERIDAALDRLDLNADCGMPWHKGMLKLEHQLHNLRHIQHHTALLAGRLQSGNGLHVDWVRPR